MHGPLNVRLDVQSKKMVNFFDTSEKSYLIVWSNIKDDSKIQNYERNELKRSRWFEK
jgi:hypothetical protein